MKKILIFILLCLLVLVASVRIRKEKSIDIQKSEPVFKYERVEKPQQKYIIKADFFKKRIRTDESKEFPAWGNAQEDSTLITITKDSLVVINNQDNDQYKLNYLLAAAQGINEFDGDRWVGVQWIATDDTGKQTILIFQKYVSKTITIIIKYGNIEYKYQGRQFKEKYKQQV
jgi:hypothetical protein